MREQATAGEWYVASAGIATHHTNPAERGLYIAYSDAGISANDVELIVALHRTIDAQLMLLANAISQEKRRWAGDPLSWYVEMTLPLARAINGEAT